VKTLKLTALVTAFALASSLTALCQAEAPASAPGVAARESVNYVIRVEWKDIKGGTHHLEVLTTEGSVKLDTFLPDKVKIDDNEIPITVTLSGDLRVLAADRARLNLFLGRTVPYVTSSNMLGSGGKSSSYQQRQVGLSSTFIVTFGKPVVIQSDEYEKVTILVKRADG
jgi:hypothetical protein